ncbi:hypothetical protein G3O08_04675 [Cryomorpha ignava]|uniref:DUF6398 domain-containing protein n=1 Tax=Cryomorpha ignava TaxID=101383 RepID=A0A7K3WMS8_9FLAO|nr:DUF6398 domain-containing protein [Cryomorpha ignava]NEN22794.1 hypothetical protein [Cryomorpha ignava]
MTKIEIKKRETELIEMTGTFCSEKLNANYAQLSVKLIKKMGRKHDVPFKRGKLEIWAAAVVYTIGSINFLFDKSFEPFILATDISDYFDTKNTSVSQKAASIKKMFNLTIYDDEFATDQMEANDPFKDMVMVDGFIMKLSKMPAEIQEQVKKERAAGREVQFFTADEDED